MAEMGYCYEANVAPFFRRRVGEDMKIRRERLIGKTSQENSATCDSFSSRVRLPLPSSPSSSPSTSRVPPDSSPSFFFLLSGVSAPTSGRRTTGGAYVKYYIIDANADS